MNLKLTSLVAAVAFFMSIGMAHAGEVVQLSASQMDRVTAGWSFDLDAITDVDVDNIVNNKANVDQDVDVDVGCAVAVCNVTTISTAVANNTTTINTNTITVNTNFNF